MTNRWLLPENIADILPLKAAKVEQLRRKILDLCNSYGYELVVPPMLEYIESLLTASGSDMDLQMYKLVDQLSGRTMGLRADMTTQVARIDAHILNHQGVTRLSYSGSTLQTRVSPGVFSREQLQIGAEIYGHEGIEADIEICSLLLASLNICELGNVTLDFSHAALIKEVLQHEKISANEISEIYQALQLKDKSLLDQIMTGWSSGSKEMILQLLDLSGEAFQVIEKCRKVLPDTPSTQKVFHDLEILCNAIKLNSPQTMLTIDLADLDGFQYHSGVMCSAYIDGYPTAIAKGGRYDEVGSAFGRSRPATGFSLDILSIVQGAKPISPQYAIQAPWKSDADLQAAIQALRGSGEVVVQTLPGHQNETQLFLYDRVLEQVNGQWLVRPINTPAP